MSKVGHSNISMMEKRFESLTIFDFQEQFPDDKSCMSYLSNIKWSGGFICPQCSNTKYCKGGKEHIRQCTKCNYLASPTSGTLFHKVKFPLLDLGDFMKANIELDAIVKTDEWTGYKPLKKIFTHLSQIPSGKRAKISLTYTM